MKILKNIDLQLDTLRELTLENTPSVQFCGSNVVINNRLLVNLVDYGTEIDTVLSFLKKSPEDIDEYVFDKHLINLNYFYEEDFSNNSYKILIYTCDSVKLLVDLAISKTDISELITYYEENNLLWSHSIVDYEEEMTVSLFHGSNEYHLVNVISIYDQRNSIVRQYKFDREIFDIAVYENKLYVLTSDTSGVIKIEEHAIK